MTSSDGVDLSYHFTIGEASHELQFHNRSSLPHGEVFENNRISALTDTVEYGHLTLHLGYLRIPLIVTGDSART